MHVCECAGLRAGQAERPLGLHDVPPTFLFRCLLEKGGTDLFIHYLTPRANG